MSGNRPCAVAKRLHEKQPCLQVPACTCLQMGGARPKARSEPNRAPGKQKRKGSAFSFRSLCVVCFLMVWGLKQKPALFWFEFLLSHVCTYKLHSVEAGGCDHLRITAWVKRGKMLGLWKRIGTVCSHHACLRPVQVKRDKPLTLF